MFQLYEEQEGVPKAAVVAKPEAAARKAPAVTRKPALSVYGALAVKEGWEEF